MSIKMVEFKAFRDKVEVNGETVLSVVAGMGVFKEAALLVLHKNGIENPQPREWYHQQNWLDSFKEIADKIGQKTLI